MAYLAAFPLEVPIQGIHGPFTRPVVWDDHRGFYNPDIGIDYDCWWAVTDTGEDIPVPVAVVEEMKAVSATGYAWKIDLTAAATVEEQTAHWTREWNRIRGDLNAAAQRVAEEARA